MKNWADWESRVDWRGLQHLKNLGNMNNTAARLRQHERTPNNTKQHQTTPNNMKEHQRTPNNTKQHKATWHGYYQCGD
jgi:hypothetical protein